MGRWLNVNNAAINVLNKEIEAQTPKVNIWDAEMATYAQEQEVLVQRGRRIHSEECRPNR